jgi:hypothetical protein
MFSTCSAGPLVAGASDLSAPVCERSPLVSLIHGVESDSLRTFRPLACLETSVSCEEPTSGQLTLWPEARPARTPAAPTPKVSASMDRKPDSSWKRSGSSRSFDRLGLSLRTHLGCELEALTGSSHAWKEWATPAGRSWWVLTTVERRTSESACGLFVPTPSAQEYGSNRGGAAGRTGPVRPSLRTKLVATPTKRDWRSGKASEATHARNSRPLNEQLDRAGLSGTAVLAAVYEWLMGYPPGWLASTSQPTETQSSRSSPRSSDDGS